jgi:hypothetical protein
MPAGGRRYESFKDYLVNEIGTDKGPFSFTGRRAVERMVEIIEPLLVNRTPDVEIVIEKGAQTGISTLALGVATFVPSVLRKNLGYYLPTQEFADRFGGTRFSTCIRTSKFLAGMMRDGKHKGLDTKGLKEFRGRFLYSLGLESVINAISIPLDGVLYDEVDVIPQENMEWSDDRIAASDWRFRMSFCVPMYPGSGIDALYQDGCGYRWLATCPGCRKEQILEDLFPANVREIDGTWRLVCVSCGKPLNPDVDADWVAERPDAVKRNRLGFRLSQLAVPAVDLGYVMRRWERSAKSRSRRAKFNCSTLALADAGDLQPITDAVLARCSEPYAVTAAAGTGPRYGGMDCGDRVHLAVHEVLEDGRKRFVYFEEMDSDGVRERMNALWPQLGLAGLVCDSKPLRTLARGLADDHPGKVWLQDFGGEELKEDESEHFGRVYQRVVVNRDDSLDELADQFTTDPARVLLPAYDSAADPIVGLVRAHLKNLQKEAATDAKGNTVYRYRRTVANHFGMAMNSSLLCSYLAGVRSAAAGELGYVSIAKRRLAAGGEERW